MPCVYEQVLCLMLGAFEDTIPKSAVEKLSQEEIEKIESNFNESSIAIASLIEDACLKQNVEDLELEDVFLEALKVDDEQ